MYGISVIMVVYDGDNDLHFEESLNSLIPNAKFYNELILVINGDISDYKKSLIKKSKEKLKINPIYLPKNIGLAKALNKAIKNVNYEWIARFDSDDINTKDRFSKIQTFIYEYGKNYDVMGTYISEFETNIQEINKLIRKVPLKIKDIKKRLIFRNPMNHVSVFFKKEIFTENNLYPPIDGFEDYALWAKLIYKGYRFKNFPEVTVFVRVGSGMVSRRGGLKYILKEFKLRKFFLNYIKKSDWPLNLLALILRVISFSLNTNFKKYIYYFIRKF